MNSKKLMVIGIDGADWKLIFQWIDNLPTFKKLVKNGVWGYLQTTIPPATVPAWPAFYTGKNPGKIGVFEFVKIKGYRTVPVSRLDVKSPPFWKLLSDHNIFVNIVNVPVTYPPEEINGIMITGMFTPSEECDYTYPKELKEEINKICEGYKIEPKQRVMCNEENILKEVKEITQKLFKVVNYLMKHKRWNVFVFVIRGTDILQHAFWRHVIEETEYKDVLKNFYKYVDKEIGKIIEKNKDTNFLLISDHGGDYYDVSKPIKTFHVNDWLRKEGFLKIKESAEFKLLINNLKLKLYNFFLRFGIDVLKIRKKIPTKKIKACLSEIPIDWKKTKVYMCFVDSGGIRINLKGREPQGAVSPEDYEKVREEIIKKLKELKDPETDDKVIEKVWKREEIYHGKYIDLAPDIIFETNKNYPPRNFITGHVFSERRSFSGLHSPLGIFLAYGKDIKNTGEEIKNVKIYDIAPTILHMFGLPIPNDMDGRVLKEIFRENSEMVKRKVVYVEPSYYERRVREIGLISEKEKIRERIRRLRIKKI